MSFVVAVVAVLVAAFALIRAGRVGARAERLAESYWELRYEVGQLKTRANRLETAAGFREPDPEPDDDGADGRMPSVTSFVPLSSLKK